MEEIKTTTDKILINREDYKKAATSVLKELARDPDVPQGMSGLILELCGSIVAAKIEIKLFGKRESEV